MAGSTQQSTLPHQLSEFEIRRAELVGDIGEVRPLPSDVSQHLRDTDIPQSLEQVLTQINALNRSLEGIIEVRHFLSPVSCSG